jgi:hypothetical protein
MGIELDGGSVSFLGVEDAALTKAKVAGHTLQASVGFVFGERSRVSVSRMPAATAAGSLASRCCRIPMAASVWPARMFARGIQVAAGRGSGDGGEEQAG